MGKKRAREEVKDVPPTDVNMMDEDGSDDEVGKLRQWRIGVLLTENTGFRYGQCRLRVVQL